MVERLKVLVRRRHRSECNGLPSPPEIGAAPIHPRIPPSGTAAAWDASTTGEEGVGASLPPPHWDGPPRATIHARRASDLG